jgi:hypothetical protein
MMVTALTKTCDYNKPHAVSRKRVKRVYFCTQNAMEFLHIKSLLFWYRGSRLIERAVIVRSRPLFSRKLARRSSKIHD